MTRTITATVLFAVAAVASAGQPVAISSGDRPQARIYYGDVDVHSAAGRSTVERRIRVTAQRLCVEGQADPVPLPPLPSYGECYELAIDGAMSQLNQIAGD